MKKLLKISLVVLFCFSSLLLASENKIYKIGFAQDTLANDWRLAQVKDVEREVERHLNLKLEVRDAKASVANQIADIEYFIKNSYDFIITSPIHASITSLALKKAVDRGIGVVLIDRGIASDDYTTFIAPDNRMIAQQAAHFMAKKMSGKGVILMLEGIEGATPTIDRREGFIEAMKQYPQIDIIKRGANFLRADAIKVMEILYKEDISFDAIYSHSDSMLSGVRYAMKKHNKDLGMLMVGIDFIDEAKIAIKNREQSASFTYPTCGKEGVEAILKLTQEEALPKIQIIESIMVTPESVDTVSPVF